MGSIRLGKLAGIEIKMHLLFLLIVAWVFIEGFSMGGAGGALVSLLHLGTLFGLVVLHELGHSLVARRLGYRVRDITLLPFGGAARMETMPRRPVHEIAIALSGPAVNVALAAAVFPLVVLSVPFQGVFPPATSALGMLFLMNVILAGFNLLPAFPMDGGRVLRGLLGLGMDRVRSTRIAALTGRVMAVAMGLAGILYPPLFMLVFIALFVWLAGRAEERAVAQQEAYEATRRDAYAPHLFVYRRPF